MSCREPVLSQPHSALYILLPLPPSQGAAVNAHVFNSQRTLSSFPERTADSPAASEWPLHAVSDWPLHARACSCTSSRSRHPRQFWLSTRSRAPRALPPARTFKSSQDVSLRCGAKAGRHTQKRTKKSFNTKMLSIICLR